MRVKIPGYTVEKANKTLQTPGRGFPGMGVFTGYQKKVLNDVCRLIFNEFSGTVGIAFLHLDCGCIKLVGVSSTGEQISPIMRVSGTPPHS